MVSNVPTIYYFLQYRHFQIVLKLNKYHVGDRNSIPTLGGVGCFPRTLLCSYQVKQFKKQQLTDVQVKITDVINSLCFKTFFNFSCYTVFVNALRGKSHLCIPFLGIVRPQSQFPHSCVCERFIYSQDRSTYFPAAEQADRSWKYISLSQVYECRNWETEHCNSVLEITVSFLVIHKWEPDIYIGFSPALPLQCSVWYHHLPSCQKGIFYREAVQSHCVKAGPKLFEIHPSGCHRDVNP